jgi:glutathione S-transferase
MILKNPEIENHQLCHEAICPFSRKLRILLEEKNINFSLVLLDQWDKKNDVLAQNSRSRTPIFFDKDNYIFICEVSNIVEYIEEKWCKNSLLGEDLVQRVEVRRLQSWFDNKLYSDVTKHILQQRYYSVFGIKRGVMPSTQIISNATHNLSIHLNYISSLLENNNYLAGGKFSIADISAAVHISTLDYFGDIKWKNFETVQSWYSLIKSRKSFSSVLKDKIPGIIPAPCYDKVDFY